MLAHKACQADAVVSSHSVYTLAVVETLGFQRDWIDKRVAVVHIDLAVHTLGSPWAGALVGINEVNAGASVHTGLGKALVALLRTVKSLVSRHALTRVSTKVVYAGRSILAGIWSALVHLFLTVAARVSSLAPAVMGVASVHTLARVPAQLRHVNTLLFSCHLTGDTGHVTIEAGPAALALTAVRGASLPACASILTGGGVTPAHQALAVQAIVALGTGTLVGAVAVLTGPSINTGVGVTLVDIMLAVAAREARRAQAGEGVDAIHAGTTIETGALSAVGGVVLAVDAAEARGAAAGVAVHEVGAVGPVLAGVAVALVDVLLTYRPTEPWQAGAHKAADAIGAGSVITAGVGLAVVDIGFAVTSRIAGFTVAPVAADGVLAGGKVSAGILHALVDVDFTGLSLPALRTHTGEALIVLRLLASPLVLTWVCSTGSEEILTVRSSVRQQAVAFVASHIINAGPLIQAGVRRTLVDICLAVGTTESNSTGADIAAGHVFTGASVHTGIGLAFIVVDVTVCTAPARVTVTFVAIDTILAGPVNAGVAVALIDLRQTGGIVVPLWADAGEAVDAVPAGAAVVAGV